MKSRLGFSIATAVEPDVLILDEVLSVGDAGLKKSLAKVQSLFDSGVTVLLYHTVLTRLWLFVIPQFCLTTVKLYLKAR